MEFIKARNEKVTLNVKSFILQEDGYFIAYSPALDLSSYGESENEAVKNFKGALLTYIQSVTTHQTLFADLKKLGWTNKKYSRKNFVLPSDYDSNKVFENLGISLDKRDVKEVQLDLAV